MLGLLSARLGGVSVFIKVILGALLLTAVIACGSSPTPTAAPAATTTATQEPAAAAESGDTIKVGVLHSLSGTMSISETAVKDASLLAIDEINANGGVMGKQIEVVIEDGASDWPTFAGKARKCIFKRRRRGNPRGGGIERRGVPAYRGQRPTVRNLLTPATGGVGPGRWHPRKSATACRTRRRYAE